MKDLRSSAPLLSEKFNKISSRISHIYQENLQFLIFSRDSCLNLTDFCQNFTDRPENAAECRKSEENREKMDKSQSWVRFELDLS